MHGFLPGQACPSCGGEHDLCHRRAVRIEPGRAYAYTCHVTRERCEYRSPARVRLMAVGAIPRGAVPLDDVGP